MNTRTLVTKVANDTHDAFLKELDRNLADAYARGRDLAVSEFEFEPVPTLYPLKVGTKLQVIFLELEPGQKPPSGRAWTVYSSGALTRLVPAGADRMGAA